MRRITLWLCFYQLPLPTSFNIHTHTSLHPLSLSLFPFLFILLSSVFLVSFPFSHICPLHSCISCRNNFLCWSNLPSWLKSGMTTAKYLVILFCLYFLTWWLALSDLCQNLGVILGPSSPLHSGIFKFLYSIKIALDLLFWWLFSLPHTAGERAGS